MRTTVDKAGRLMLHKTLRDQVGLWAGEVTVVGTSIVVEPADVAVLDLADELARKQIAGGAVYDVLVAAAARESGITLVTCGCGPPAPTGRWGPLSTWSWPKGASTSLVFPFSMKLSRPG